MRSERLTELEWNLSVARKKSQTNKYLENLDNMTDDDIMSLMEPLWARKLLVEIKPILKKLNEDRKSFEELKTRIEPNIKIIYNNDDQKYECRIWIGDSIFTKHQNSEIELKHNSLLLFKKDHVLYDNIKLDYNQLFYINSKQYNMFTESEYRSEYRDLINKSHNIQAVTNSLYTIQRH